MHERQPLGRVRALSHVGQESGALAHEILPRHAPQAARPQDRLGHGPRLEEPPPEVRDLTQVSKALHRHGRHVLPAVFKGVFEPVRLWGPLGCKLIAVYLSRPVRVELVEEPLRLLHRHAQPRGTRQHLVPREGAVSVQVQRVEQVIPRDGRVCEDGPPPVLLTQDTLLPTRRQKSRPGLGKPLPPLAPFLALSLALSSAFLGLALGLAGRRLGDL
mmetsp:Transcript_40819/g.91832  ORF Transcript_40819/g.91832 Transcript_40819/m.91832 type:complete len:216 (-) Transcript_40819:1789-2436(-)